MALVALLLTAMPNHVQVSQHDLPGPELSAPDVPTGTGVAQMGLDVRTIAAHSMIVGPAYATRSVREKSSARKKAVEKKAPTAAEAKKQADAEQAAAAKKSAADRAAEKKADEKAGKPPVYRLDQGESLPGPEPIE